MKIIFAFVLTLTCTAIFGQKKDSIHVNSLVLNNDLTYDSLPRVFYINDSMVAKKPAFFLNKQFVDATVITALDPFKLENLDIVHDRYKKDGVEYYGKIYVSTKSNYYPVLISLDSLKNKYLKPTERPILFMIDGKIINGDYAKHMVDEKYILSITVDQIDTPNGHIHLTLIKLLIRSPENIEKSKQIRIRGNADHENAIVEFMDPS